MSDHYRPYQSSWPQPSPHDLEYRVRAMEGQISLLNEAMIHSEKITSMKLDRIAEQVGSVKEDVSQIDSQIKRGVLAVATGAALMIFNVMWSKLGAM